MFCAHSAGATASNVAAVKADRMYFFIPVLSVGNGWVMH
jgi:hypothetical protein